MWPDVPVAHWRTCLFEIERITRLVLTGSSTTLRLPTGALTRSLGIAAFTSGMGPLLGHWVATGRLGADADVAALLAAHREHAGRRAARMRADLIRATTLLADAAVETTVLKGFHTGWTYFPDPATRPAADIDLLIPPESVPTAERALQAAGYTQMLRETRPYKVEWRPPDSPRHLRSLDLTHADNPWTLELHATLDRDFFGIRKLRFPRPDALRLAPHPDSDVPARVLTQPVLLAFLAAHASHEFHRLPLLHLVELALVSRVDAADGTLWDRVLASLDRGGALRFAYPAIELAERLAPGTVPAAVRQHLALAATPRARQAVEPMRPGGLQRLEHWALAERLMWASGPLELARCLLRLAWPTAQGRPASELFAIYRRRILRVLRGRASAASRDAVTTESHNA